MKTNGIMFTRLAVALFVLPALFLWTVGARYVSAAPARQAGPQTFTAYLGHEIFTEPGQKSSWQAWRFYPENITVNAGDTIVWKHNGGVDPHTVSFLGPDNKVPDFALPPTGSPPKVEVNPSVVLRQGAAEYDGTAYANSGVMASDIPGPKEYELTFTKPGTYKFICLVHAWQLPDGTILGMQGQLTVQAEGSPLPQTPGQVEADAKAMMSADEKAATQAEPEAKKQAVSSSPGPNGTMVHHVNSGYQLRVGTLGGVLDYMRFSPKEIEISVGDTVEWSGARPTSFHNVIFGDEPDVLLIEPQAAGPPKVFANPSVFGPMGSKLHMGTGVYSSGILNGPEGLPSPGSVTNYSLTFSQPGRFEYVCGVHYHNGMDGYVVVRAITGGGGQPGMPNTGSPLDWLMAPAAVASALVLLAGIALRMRRIRRMVQSNSQ
jgi:plastocyanin